MAEQDTQDLQRLSREIPRALSKDARLFNYEHSTVTKLFGRMAAYIPVAIADSDQGRETVYELPAQREDANGHLRD